MIAFFIYCQPVLESRKVPKRSFEPSNESVQELCFIGWIADSSLYMLIVKIYQTLWTATYTTYTVPDHLPNPE